MHILYVSQYFPPEGCAPAVRVSELARAWVRAGHRVTVLTSFPQHPLGVKAPGDRGRLRRVESLDGIEVVRTYVYATANRGMLRRMLSYASFLVSAVLFGRGRVGKPDVVIGTSPQLLAALAGYMLARSLGARFIFEVRDLWPESILAVEAMRDNLLVRALKRLAAFLYWHSDQIVTVGQGYRLGIHARYGTPLEKILVVPNGVDHEQFAPRGNRLSLRRELGWDGRFVVLYIGTHGMAHGLEQLLAAAKALGGEPDKQFVLVGEGAEKDRLKALAREWSLANVQFIDQQPRQRVAELYRAGDLGVVMLRDTPLFQEVLPSKIFEYLAMEKPILLSVDGEARRLVEAAGAGQYVRPGDTDALVAAIRQAAREPERWVEMGRRGRDYVLANHDRQRLAGQYLTILEAMLGGPPAAKPAAALEPELVNEFV